MVKVILRLEGLVIFLTALYFYNLVNGNWIIFVALVLTPDISMIGYIKNKRLGAILYNFVHNYILALFIVFCGTFILGNPLITSVGFILLAHVALDRLLGYGLKYPTNFKDTHLQKL